ncbi:MAG: alanine racemase [Planctomycetota bacterium]
MLRIRHNEARTALPARIWADIDLDAVRGNLARVRARIGARCRIVAVVKANAYGHGASMVARAAIDAGAHELAVADCGEGARLRADGVDAPICILGPSLPEEAQAILENRLVPTVCDFELARALDGSARSQIVVDVELDTGMRRHGVAHEDAVAFVRSLRVFRNLRVRSVFTHFAGLDEEAVVDMRQQWERFCVARSELAQAGYELQAHACNSLGTDILPEAHADAVRVGGALYGFDAGSSPSGLRPALTLKTRVCAVHGAAPGDRVGYGGMYCVERATTLALLPCGYADGLSRAHWNGGHALVRGVRVPIVGHVSMNQTVLDVGDMEIAPGDEVVLLGAQGSLRIRAEERAAAGSSPYEVTTLLRAELVRRYVGAESAVARQA